MTKHQFDAVLFLRLAGSRCGVQGRYIPFDVIDTAKCLGGQVRFERDRIYVRNATKMISKVLATSRASRPGG